MLLTLSIAVIQVTVYDTDLYLTNFSVTLISRPSMQEYFNVKRAKDLAVQQNSEWNCKIELLYSHMICDILNMHLKLIQLLLFLKHTIELLHVQSEL